VAETGEAELSLVASSALVDPVYRPSAAMPVRTLEEFLELRRRSLEDLGAYWAQVASELEWMRPFDRALEGSLPDFRFFVGGEANVSANCIDRHARRDGSAVALRFIGEDRTERTLTYRELEELTARFARVLRELGVDKGDVVAIYLPNLLETFAAIHACYRIGAIYNVIFSGFSAKALYERLVDTGAKVVVTADEAVRRGRRLPLKAVLDSVLGDVPSVSSVVVVRRTGTPEVPMSPPRDRFFDEAVEHASGEEPPHPIEANEPGFLIYTSGTTSKPKALVHAGIGFLVGAYHNVRYALDLAPPDVYWCTADVGWLTFPIFEVVGALVHGAVGTIVYEGALDYPEPDRFYEIVERHGVTKVFTAPTLLRMLARYGDEWLRRHDLSSLGLVSLVGEPLDASTWHWVADVLGKGRVEVNNTYGQSETGSAWTSSAVGVTPAKPGSAGMALPGHAYAVVDEDGRELPPGRVGELALLAPFPALARDIWRDRDRYLSQYFPEGGRYRTRDAAVEDEDGHVFVIGRVDDVINVAAHRLSTMEMEAEILTLPGVAEAAVVGVPDEVKGQVPVAFVTLAAGGGAPADPEQAIADQIVRAIGPIARPAAVYVVDALPKTRSGKIVRRLLKEIVTTGEAKGDVTGLEDPEILPALVAQLRR
jgi:acetyl-CoA synthetase